MESIIKSLPQHKKTIYIQMKKSLLFIALLGLTYACKDKPEEQSDLAKMMQERDSLSLLVNQAQMRINELSGLIAEKDSTQKMTFVSALEVESGTFEHYIELYGTVESDQNATLLPETGGTINHIYVKEGDVVRKGQSLIQLDASIILNNIKEIETQLELANTLYEKQDRLWKQKIGSEVQYLQAKNNKESLEKRLGTLNSQLAQTNIRAPFSGVIDEIFAKIGQLAGPQTPLIRLINLDMIHIVGDVPESYIGKIVAGSDAKVVFGSFDKIFETKVSQTGNFINPANRTFKIRLDVDNQSQMLKPNAMANILIKDYQADSTVVLPNRVILQDPFGNNFVYTVSDNGNGLSTVHRVPITVGRTYQASTEVLEGLEPGMRVVDKGSRSIKDLQLVKLITENEA